MNRARYTTALSALLLGVAVASIFLLRGKANSDETKAPNLAAASESAADAAKKPSRELLVGTFGFGSETIWTLIQPLRS